MKLQKVLFRHGLPLQFKGVSFNSCVKFNNYRLATSRLNARFMQSKHWRLARESRNGKIV
jgi:hypothetical protein